MRADDTIYTRREGGNDSSMRITTTLVDRHLLRVPFKESRRHYSTVFRNANGSAACLKSLDSQS